MMDWDDYAKGMIEPKALELPTNTDPSVAFAFSSAVSLKRIADALEKMNEPVIVDSDIRLDSTRDIDPEVVARIVEQIKTSDSVVKS